MSRKLMSIVASLLALAAIAVAPGLAQAVTFHEGGETLEEGHPVTLGGVGGGAGMKYRFGGNAQWSCSPVLDGEIAGPGGEEILITEYHPQPTRCFWMEGWWDEVTPIGLPWHLHIDSEGNVDVEGFGEKHTMYTAQSGGYVQGTEMLYGLIGTVNFNSENTIVEAHTKPAFEPFEGNARLELQGGISVTE